MSSKETITKKEAADYANVSDATIQRWISLNQLITYKVKGQWRIDKDFFEDFCKKRESPTDQRGPANDLN